MEIHQKWGDETPLVPPNKHPLLWASLKDHLDFREGEMMLQMTSEALLGSFCCWESSFAPSKNK